MNRYSILYLLKGQYQHIGSATHSEALAILEKLATDQRRTPIGIYDAKTELFEWEPTRQQDYNLGDIEAQGRLGDQIITIAQALRRRDSHWYAPDEFRKPSIFA